MFAIFAVLLQIKICYRSTGSCFSSTLDISCHFRQKDLKFIVNCFQTLEAVVRRCSVRKGLIRNFARPATLFNKETQARVFL